MASRLQQIEGDESVLLRITHSNLKSFSTDVRFSLQMSVESLKEKLWRKCGTSVNSMSLQLYDDTNTKLSDLSDDSKPLGFYSPLDGYRLHVIDLDPSSVTSGGWLEDTSLVEKYKISEEEYGKRDGTFRKFKEKMISQNSSALESKITDNYMENLCANIKVGDRCEVDPGAKRGVVKYLGRAESLAPGFWVGIQYDEPLGKHDGIVKGIRYFNCPPLHGAMVRPDKVKLHQTKVPFMQELEFKNSEKFKDDIPTARQVALAQNVSFDLSKPNNPTPESPISSSPGLSPFFDDGFGCTSSQRPIRVKKAKLKRKNNKQLPSFFNKIFEDNQQLIEMLKKINLERKQQLDIEKQTLAFKKMKEENRILLLDLISIADPNIREFLRAEQARIIQKRNQRGSSS